MDTSKGTERINEEGATEINVDATNYKTAAGHEQEEPQKEDVKITHVPLTYEKRGTRDAMAEAAAKVAEKVESAKETVSGAGSGTESHNKTD